jgi:hypothetical protein
MHIYNLETLTTWEDIIEARGAEEVLLLLPPSKLKKHS